MVAHSFRRLAFLALMGVTAAAAHAQTTPTSIQLTWTSPGDDGNVGTASEYDLRYSTSPITSGSFGSATRWTSMPAPAVAGTTQNVTVTGLTPSTTYYFALKTADNVPNWSNLSNVLTKATPAAPDIRPPAPIALNVTGVTDTTATLGWAAVGDDSLTGTANSYDIRYSTSAITPSNWGSATTVTGEPNPAASGTSQSYTVRSLLRERTYHFAIRVLDDAGNISPLSNVPSSTTSDSMPPSAIPNLSANFVWLAWHTSYAVRPQRSGDR